jgi:cyclophilin family peptidyl-prolyl cis-trans isomerase
LERLDDRVVPAITFDPISNFTFPGGKDLFVPLTASDGGQAINYTAQSLNSSITATLETSTTTIKFTVSGKDKDGNSFTGDISLRLFSDIAPLATARITQLVNSGYYNGKLFHRVIEDFMAQGGSLNGDGTGGSNLGSFDDEFNSSVTFVSPGLLAMANSGNDTNDAQFFIVDNDITLAQMPQHLNFKHTIFGQLVDGFDIFDKIMGTPVGPQSGAGSEVSKPLTNVVIQSAVVDATNTDGVLRIHSADGFVGSSQITVTATDVNGQVQQTFTVNSQADTINDRPFLGTLANISTAANTPVTIDLPATDLENDQLTFVVWDPSNPGSAPKNVTVSINQGAHTATITPIPGFSGTTDLLIGVRDQTNRGGVSLNDPVNFNTQKITLTVSAADIDLDSASDNGLYTDDNFTSDGTPSFTIKAPTGQTVTVHVNGSGDFAATESTTNPGTYTVTLPAGKLQVGTNVISADVTGGNQGTQALTPLTMIYAPGSQSVFVVPGAPGTTQQLSFTLQSASSFFKDESGIFVVDDASGKIGTLSPGDPGYAKAALQRRQVIFTRGQRAGATTTLSLQAGTLFGFYLAQNTTAQQVLASNPNDKTRKGAAVAFFSFSSANGDGITHVLANVDGANGRGVYAWEDLTGGGDLDYNDRVITVKLQSDTTAPAEAFRVPAGPGRQVTATFQLQAALRALHAPAATTSGAAGEIGFFVVDDASGRIGNLHPGDAGYSAAALANATVLFNQGDPQATSKTQAMTGGVFFGFYIIKGGDSATLKAQNPTNSATGSVVAFFSFATANPDNHDTHFRTFDPEGASIGATPTDNESLKVHAMGTAFGTANNFDDAFFTVNFTAITNRAPSVTSLSLDPSTVGTNDKLTATAFASDPSGLPISLTYVWRVNGVVKRTNTTTQLTDQFDLSVPGNGDRGDVVVVEVTPSNGTATGDARTATVTVGNTVPVVSQIAFTPAKPGTNDLLTGNVTATDADNDPISFHYVWKVGTTVRRDVTLTTPSDTFDLSAAGNGDRGQTVTLEVTPSDATGSGAMVSQSVTIANYPPTATVELNPNTNVFNDALLTATATTADGDNDNVFVSYKWMVNGVTVKSVDHVTDLTDTLDLTTTAAKPGDVVTVQVTPNDGIEDGTPATTQVTLLNRAPTTDGIPDQSFNGPGAWNLVVAGRFHDADKDQLTFAATLADGSPLPAWLTFDSGGFFLGNPRVSDAANLSIKVTATDPSGASISTTFALDVSNSPQSLNDLPSVDSINFSPTAPVAGDTLTANITTTDGDGDNVTVTYTWKVNGSQVQQTSDTGAKSDSVNLTNIGAVQGDTVSVEVVPFDGTDHGTLVSKSVVVG